MVPLILATLHASAVAEPIVLFGGKDCTEWVHRGTDKPCEWKVERGELVVTPGMPDVITKRQFGDYQLHLEYWLPLMSDATSQGRANSGVYNLGRYEVQILDSWKNDTYAFAGCGAIYGEKEPDTFALVAPQVWNRYDIKFTAPRFDAAGVQTQKPRITVWQNGIRIHNDYEIQACPTTAGIDGPPVARGPILLQNHGSQVRFRNIWIVPLDANR